MGALQAFSADLQTAPQWVQLWVSWMTLVMALAFVFAFFRKEARVAALVIVLTIPAMVGLHAAIGFVRLLGVVHVVLWTPLMIYLWRRRAHWRVKDTIAGKYLLVLFVTMMISLVFDYADVARWLLGERG